MSFARPDWSHNEEGIAGRVQQVERSCSPVLVLGPSKNGHLCAPFPVINVGIINLKRYTGISPMTIHRTVKGQLDRSTLKAEEPGSAIVGSLKRHLKAKSIYVECLCSRQILGRENRYRSLHEIYYNKVRTRPRSADHFKIGFWPADAKTFTKPRKSCFMRCLRMRASLVSSCA